LIVADRYARAFDALRQNLPGSSSSEPTGHRRVTIRELAVSARG
jgi:hypothetical protein